MKKGIALVDCNNFYAACEQTIDPSLSGLPLVVLSNNDGCIIARSSEARALGIPMGQPYFKARLKLERLGVHIRSSNYELYGDMSQRLMQLLNEHCERLEIYSIDEAFIKLSSSYDYDFSKWASKIRALAYQNLGIPVTIGIGYTKGQAKIANHIAKANPSHAGVLNIGESHNIEKYMESVEIENVWGIGKKMAKLCRRQGITNAQELITTPEYQIKTKLGIIGIRIQMELKGIICLPIRKEPRKKKETCVSRSFSSPLINLIIFKHEMISQIHLASQKLRKQGQVTGEIRVFTNSSIHKEDFYAKEAILKLDVPSNDTRFLINKALPLIKEIYNKRACLIRTGIVMKDLKPAQYIQSDLFSNDTIGERNRKECLQEAIDKINISYGKGTINWSNFLINKSLIEESNNKSSISTRKISKVPIAWA